MNGFEMILPFLKPIEHLILNDSINEVMVNGANRLFIEKQGSLQQVSGVSLGEKSLTVAVKNIARRLGMKPTVRSMTQGAGNSAFAPSDDVRRFLRRAARVDRTSKRTPSACCK